MVACESGRLLESRTLSLSCLPSFSSAPLLCATVEPTIVSTHHNWCSPQAWLFSMSSMEPCVRHLPIFQRGIISVVKKATWTILCTQNDGVFLSNLYLRSQQWTQWLKNLNCFFIFTEMDYLQWIRIESGNYNTWHIRTKESDFLCLYFMSKPGNFTFQCRYD